LGIIRCCLLMEGGRWFVDCLSMMKRCFSFFKEVCMRSHSGFLKELNFYVMVAQPPFGMMSRLGGSN
jgi:hypothetical protein